VLLLPAKTRYEQDDGGMETSTERRVMFTPELPRQVGEAKAEWKILRELAVATYPERAHLLGCETGWKMREEIARLIPLYDGVQHLKKTGDAFQYSGPHLFAGGKFWTPDGKAHFSAVQLPVRVAPETLTNGLGRAVTNGACVSFMVSTRRGKQFNSLIYAEVDPLTGAPRDAVFMSPEDATALHLIHGDRVRLRNDLGALDCSVFLAPIARGNLQVHWPESNTIIRRGALDDHSGVPDYNAQVVVERRE
jgi:predicted molibdopterin-dependent oxidoreductase YjgC